MDDLDKILNTVEATEINDIVKEVLDSGDFDLKGEVNNHFTYTRRISLNDIVPEEYQQKLMQIDITMTQCFWLIGDIVNDLVNSVNYTRSKELGKVVSKQNIYEAVGFFCHRTARSVRYYYECAWFFPPEIRQKYEVPFNIYALARWIDNWELVLKLADENPMWSAERVREEYYKAINETPPVHPEKPAVLSDAGAEIDYPEPQEGEIWRGEPRSGYRTVLLSKLDHTVDDLSNVLDKIPLSTDIRVRIGAVLVEIQDIELEIKREM